MKYNKYKKGFTIIELVITLGVFAIVGTLVTGLVVMASNFTTEQNRISNTMREIDESKEMVINWFSKYDTVDYLIVGVEENKVLIDGNILEYANGKVVTAEATVILKDIVNVKFSNVEENKLIKCMFILYDDQEFSFLISRRSMY